jgi:hypothetical protein
MPSHAKENMLKRDRIPSLALLQRRKPALLAYWRALMEEYPKQFASEVNMSLTGRSYDSQRLVEEAFKGLEEKTRFLIEYRGYPEWGP